MGMCASCEAGIPVTAKVILDDGELREYSKPVKAALVLRKEGPACFLCDADNMDFNGFVSAVDEADDIFPGQLYFVLPASMLRKPLQAEQIAALAAKASAALMHGVPTSRRRSRRKGTLIFAEPSSAPPPMTRKISGGKWKRDFAVSLGAIPE